MFEQNRNLQGLLLKATKDTTFNPKKSKFYIPNIYESLEDKETNSFALTFGQKTKAWTINEARTITDLTQRESHRILKGIPVGNT